MEFTPGILDTVLNLIQGAIETAVPVLQPDVAFLLRSFLIVSIVFSGVGYAFGSLSGAGEFMVKKILLISGALFLVTNWLPFTQVIVESFVELGLAAGGSGVEVDQLTKREFLSPSSIIALGYNLGDQLFQRAGEAGGFIGFSVNFVVLLIAGLIVCFSFVIIGLQVFVTLLEFKFVTLGGFVLIPFALLDRTSNIASGALRYVFAAGVRLFTLAVIVSFAFAIFPNIEVPETFLDSETLPTIMTIIATSFVFVLLALTAPNLASSMLGGGPQLGVGAVGQAAAVVGGAGFAAAKAGGAAYATGGAMRSATGVAAGATRMAGAAASKMSQSAGGMAAAARSGGGQTTKSRNEAIKAVGVAR